MNSNERHQIRYIRRKAKRNINRQNKGSVYDDFEQVFSWENLYQSYKQCCLGVSWKHSTQLYKINSTLNITKTYKELKDGKFKPKGFNEFTINERGKVRHIKSIHLSERVIQKCLCDYSLIPMLSPSFIYDNGACLKGKGIDFTLSRLKRHLQQFYRIYGNDGYILVFDFSKYFDTIQHDILKAEIAKQYTDKRLIDVINKMIDSFGGECGLGLGSQISQICALYYPNKIDHIVKEQLRIKYYGRYMDDGYLIHHDKQYLQKCLKIIKASCESIGLKLNEHKTQIIKLSRYFTFLKKRIKITESGKVVMKIFKKSITAMHRKLKKLQKDVIDGKITRKDVEMSVSSWIGYTKRFNAWHSRTNVLKMYKRLFGGNKWKII